MNGLFIAAISVIGFLAAYKFYGTYISDKILSLDPYRKTPAHELNDGVDFVPTRKSVLFGHHYATIAGLGPILGPAIGVIWGWVPALLWVLFGSIFFGAVHDLSSLAISLRHQGRSIGDLTEDIIGKRARTLLLLITFILLTTVLGLFVFIVALLFMEIWYPQAVVPVFSLMGLAVMMGILVYKKHYPLGPVSIVGIALMLFSLWLGIKFPVVGVSQNTWILVLLIYSGLASMLPVWLLLQPRDYLNSFLLYFGMAGLYIGLIVAHPKIVAPAYNTAPPDLPLLWPIMFTVIMCGAISGFHCLVSTGTTVRQLDNERDAKLIGYGAMLGEGALAVIVILACTAGIATTALWHEHYASWKAAEGLGPKLDAFISGGGYFLSRLGLPLNFSKAFIALVVVSFAMTTLDSGARLLRYNIEALAKSANFKPLTNRYAASAAAVLCMAYFAMVKIGGQPAGITLVRLGGTTNQLMAGLALLAVSIYLYKARKPTLSTVLPMTFMLVTTIAAAIINTGVFIKQGAWILVVVGGIILALSVWLVAEAGIAYRVYSVKLKEAQEGGPPIVTPAGGSNGGGEGN